MASMKKTYYYNFLPTKKEEMSAILSPNRPYQTNRILIEIRDDTPNPTILFPQSPPQPTLSMSSPFDQNNNPWRIRKHLDTHEITTGKIHLTHDEVFEYVFRYSSLESANNVVTGNKVKVSVCDLTEENTPLLYGPGDEQTYLMKGLNDEYVLGLNMALVRSRGFKKDDEIGIYYDPRTRIFYFKVFH